MLCLLLVLLGSSPVFAEEPSDDLSSTELIDLTKQWNEYVEEEVRKLEEEEKARAHQRELLLAPQHEFVDELRIRVSDRMDDLRQIRKEIDQYERRASILERFEVNRGYIDECFHHSYVDEMVRVRVLYHRPKSPSYTITVLSEVAEDRRRDTGVLMCFEQRTYVFRRAPEHVADADTHVLFHYPPILSHAEVIYPYSASVFLPVKVVLLEEN